MITAACTGAILFLLGCCIHEYILVAGLGILACDFVVAAYFIFQYELLTLGW